MEIIAANYSSLLPALLAPGCDPGNVIECRLVTRRGPVEFRSPAIRFPPSLFVIEMECLRLEPKDLHLRWDASTDHPGRCHVNFGAIGGNSDNLQPFGGWRGCRNNWFYLSAIVGSDGKSNYCIPVQRLASLFLGPWSEFWLWGCIEEMASFVSREGP